MGKRSWHVLIGGVGIGEGFFSAGVSGDKKDEKFQRGSGSQSKAKVLAMVGARILRALRIQESRPHENGRDWESETGNDLKNAESKGNLIPYPPAVRFTKNSCRTHLLIDSAYVINQILPAKTRHKACIKHFLALTLQVETISKCNL